MARRRTPPHDKRDENEPEIIEALQWAGCEVQPLSGKDVPDLLVLVPRWDSAAATLALIEVKNGRGKLSPGQSAWHEAWATAPVYVAYTPEDALAAVDGLRMPERKRKRRRRCDPRYVRVRQPTWRRT
jgi:hypothetical protein